ncbi:hypothetical protein Nepgr_029644 [Nepenthes gracilis]|uniref:Major facilitator superfamily (MFS) profile domain-containing protein n=1 Tax=Nepenthes gracilis TaxID=150966 RepID=A0AAD3TFA6_NEPGR|nr:hypothetical protein Nepgr_029644 [Nepenthes gracilis]
MDRVNRSIAILPKSQEFNWKSAIVGLIQFFSFWGYLLTQIVGSLWADKIGGKLVLGFGVIGWSVAIVLTPIAARINLPYLLIMRVIMGMGEGVAMPAMNNIISKICFLPNFTPQIWRASVFGSFESLGGVWVALWLSKAYGLVTVLPWLTRALFAKYRRLDGRHTCDQRPCGNISPEDHAINGGSGPSFPSFAAESNEATGFNSVKPAMPSEIRCILTVWAIFQSPRHWAVLFES